MSYEKLNFRMLEKRHVAKPIFHVIMPDEHPYLVDHEYEIYLEGMLLGNAILQDDEIVYYPYLNRNHAYQLGRTIEQIKEMLQKDYSHRFDFRKHPFHLLRFAYVEGTDSTYCKLIYQFYQLKNHM